MEDEILHQRIFEFFDEHEIEAVSKEALLTLAHMGLSIGVACEQLEDSDELKDILQKYKRSLIGVAAIGLERQVESLFKTIELIQLDI